MVALVLRFGSVRVRFMENAIFLLTLDKPQVKEVSAKAVEVREDLKNKSFEKSK
jgi:hypothetical protein